MQRITDANCGRTQWLHREPDGEGVRMHFGVLLAGVNGLPATGFLRLRPAWSEGGSICARRTRLYPGRSP